ncbi:MAG: hypothetical protein K6B65_01350 [Bacilli bacterium]|nr:hypothetical protein [Bacilli bacterium]
MKRASQILLLIGEIVEIVGAAVLLLLGIGFLVFALPSMTDVLIEGLENGSIQTSFVGTNEEAARMIQATFSGVSVLMFVLAAFSAVGAIITIFARRNPTLSLLVATIILGIISGTEVAAVGAIFGIVSTTKEEQSIDKRESAQ